jgi:hypothetical protein
MAPKKQPKNAFQKFMDLLKIKYLNGQNPIGRMQSSYGFTPSSNAALNLGKLLINVPYDPETRIRKGDPQKELRANNSRIGQIERIHNTYVPGRVKLAD